MSPGHDRGPAPASTGPANDHHNLNEDDDIRRGYICAECGRHRIARGRRMCPGCIRDYIAAIRRRHAADLRVSRWSE